MSIKKRLPLLCFQIKPIRGVYFGDTDILYSPWISSQPKEKTSYKPKKRAWRDWLKGVILLGFRYTLLGISVYALGISIYALGISIYALGISIYALIL